MGVVMRLHLGVLDVPYSKEEGKTTGDVATILEDKYHVMSTFVDVLGRDAIAAAFEQAAKSAVEDLFSGAPTPAVSLTGDATEEVQSAFRVFIDQREMDGLVPGVPTAASLKGMNHRFSRPNARGNPVRPSFRDTGLYETSFRAWTDD
jgi:hypothetical protein